MSSPQVALSAQVTTLCRIPEVEGQLRDISIAIGLDNQCFALDKSVGKVITVSSPGAAAVAAVGRAGGGEGPPGAQP